MINEPQQATDFLNKLDYLDLATTSASVLANAAERASAAELQGRLDSLLTTLATQDAIADATENFDSAKVMNHDVEPKKVNSAALFNNSSQKTQPQVANKKELVNKASKVLQDELLKQDGPAPQLNKIPGAV